MIEGKLVNLAPLRAADRDALLDWINDRSTVTWNAAYRPVDEVAHEGWFEAVQQRSDMVIFGIRTAADDRLVGTCQLHSISPVHRSAELQIRLGEAASRGQGLGGEAVRLLVEFGFRDLNLERIYLHVFESNAPALAAYEKVGFRREGLARRAAFVDGAWRDVVLMGLLREDYSDGSSG